MLFFRVCFFLYLVCKLENISVICDKSVKSLTTMRLQNKTFFLQMTITMNNFLSQKCTELRNHCQYTVKLSISISPEQRESMLRREKCH